MERWNINAADPILLGDQLFISTFGRGCALLQVKAGPPAVIWENKEMGNHFNSCVFLGGYVTASTETQTEAKRICAASTSKPARSNGDTRVLVWDRSWPRMAN